MLEQKELKLNYIKIKTMKEIWKPVYTTYQNFEPNSYHKTYQIRDNKYEVSNTGKIRNIHTKQEYTIDKQGRVTFDIEDWKYYDKYARCTFPVSRIMYSSFIEPLKFNQRVYFKKAKEYNINNLFVKP